MIKKYGLHNIASRYAERLIVSIVSYQKRDSRIALVGKFMGIQSHDQLPSSVFNFYIHLVKHANIDINTLFTGDITKINVSYNQVNIAFKNLISQLDDF